MELTWEEISKKLSGAADYTVRETEKLTGMAKLKYKAANEKNRLSTLYRSLGSLVYARTRGEAVENGAEDALIAQITEALAALAKLEAEMSVLRSWKLCVGCGTKIGAEMAFCPKCGTRQPAPAAPADAGESGS